jgi:hypothetical protein
MAKKPRYDDDVEETVVEETVVKPPAAAEKVQTIEEQGIGARDPYPTKKGNPDGTS